MVAIDAVAIDTVVVDINAFRLSRDLTRPSNHVTL